MQLNFNGVTIELPNDVKVDVSEDGKFVRVTTKPVEEKIVEKVRIVEVPVPVQERIRVVERIVEVEKPCTRPHYPTYPTYQWPYQWVTTSPNWNHTVTCGSVGTSLFQAIGGSTNIVGNLPQYNSSTDSTNIS